MFVNSQRINCFGFMNEVRQANASWDNRRHIYVLQWEVTYGKQSGHFWEKQNRGLDVTTGEDEYRAAMFITRHISSMK